MTLSVDVTSGGSGLDRFQWMVRAVRWADEVGPLVRTALKAAAPVGKGPRRGRMRDNIRYSRTTTGSSVRAEFRAYTPYAGFVIGGTRPHEISARAARTLHWTDAGGEHFARRVQHPGTRPNRFHVTTMRRMTPIVQAAYRRFMEAP